MQCDYYALKYEKMNSTLGELEQLVNLKNTKDKELKMKLKETAQKAAKIEPHMAYLWFKAKKEEAERVGDRKVSKIAADAANEILEAWRQTLNVKFDVFKEFEFLPKLSDILDKEDHSIINLPLFSFILWIPFCLKKAFISKDDCDFHLLDNPLRKEKIFKVPTVSASSWKGALRSALWQLGYKEDDEVIIRLFGNPRQSEEGQAGRLCFYPTFFDRIGLEVINPHNRQKGVGERGPILMECVPEGTKGVLLLLYAPFGPVDQDEQELRCEVAQDLEVLAQGIQSMLTNYGFGAKTSSGFGIAELDDEDDEGMLAIKQRNVRQPLPFKTLGELLKCAQHVADQLRNGGIA